ncbi:A/G-specific adenine glycosylase [Ramlibacter monticola]|uniref:Adenine DNA glycosylase n=1 Tax=Ramlibacter monticola TaxID=1926872 RepID=A0A936Z3K9_9BURK|nr:A/G-specific adenine glycosylase [Ramlibacter monticola]MBL0393269.1 A/G-specific adenine glycosylase [Ramlibacter monticola]
MTNASRPGRPKGEHRKAEPEGSCVTAGFAGRVVRWQQTHGRNELPWQNTRDPYRVWLSEVMLQQTQVAAVLGYYERFLQRFPDVGALAAAPLDDVLALWSGLGYYSRARNLHRCAQEVVLRHGGAFPRTAQELQELPGIGASTAAAISSFCFGERAAILDGNVKRVLTRVLGFREDLSVAANERALWEHARALLPTRELHEAMPRYTQGLMDLGATVCQPRNPACLVCPVQEQCVALREGRPEEYPVKTRRLKRSAESLWLLHARAGDGSVWLQKRPTPGVWAGLYCLPVFASRDALEQALPAAARRRLREVAPFVHVLTHKDLHLHPVQAKLPADWSPGGGAWFAAGEWPALGLPAPVRRFLENA